MESTLDAARQRLDLERQALRREADQLKDDFVALVSHELRTPLASIIATLEVLADETERLSPDGRRFLDVIDRNARRRWAGTGLGLWIADAIARMHDGTIAVHSEVGAGTIFIVVLPAARPAASTRRGAP